MLKRKRFTVVMIVMGMEDRILKRALQSKKKSERAIGRPLTRRMDQAQKNMEAKGVVWRHMTERAVSGLISDSRQIVETARSEASNYRAQYGTNIPLKYLNERVAMYMHAYTLYSAVRPFGCSIILGTYEQDGPVMYMIDPSGVSY
ncbi:unnamed protein product, partial [Timema podura]|nr:unnamed protein product [Timema podura]